MGVTDRRRRREAQHEADPEGSVQHSTLQEQLQLLQRQNAMRTFTWRMSLRSLSLILMVFSLWSGVRGGSIASIIFELLSVATLAAAGMFIVEPKQLMTAIAGGAAALSFVTWLVLQRTGVLGKENWPLASLFFTLCFATDRIIALLERQDAARASKFM